MGTQPVYGRLLPLFLFISCLIPSVFGVYRLAELLAQGQFVFHFEPQIVDRLPLMLHITGGLGFLLLGALQLLPAMRHRWPNWHRGAGRWIAVLGLIGALSGVWLTLFHPAISSPLLYWGRLGAGLFWALAILLAVKAIIGRQFAAHCAWMIRAYAIALPAGTLGLILLPLVLVVGEQGNEQLFELIQVLAWPAHLAVAERLIRRHQSRNQQAAPLRLLADHSGATR